MKHSFLLLVILVLFGCASVNEKEEESDFIFYSDKDENDMLADKPAPDNDQIKNNINSEAQADESQVNQPAAATTGDRLQVTLEISRQKELVPQLQYYLSTSFILKIDPDKRQAVFELTDGMLILRENENEELRFPAELQGEFKSYEEGRFFEILFKPDGKEALLRFNRNQNVDSFDLVSVLINETRYPVNISGDPVRLTVYGQNQRETIVTGGTTVSASSGTGSSSSGVTAEARAGQSGQQQQRQQQQRVNEENIRQGRTNNIIGFSSLTVNGVLRYIKERNNNILNDGQITSIINIYLEEALFERVNPDIAIAQMLYVTSFLRNSSVRNTNNYGGLSVPGSRWNGKPWNGKFSSPIIGIRAHIHHLRHYAVGRTRRSGNTVNPRFRVLEQRGYLGTVVTFEQLYGRWAPDYRGYGNEIDSIIRGLRSYSDRYQ